MSGPFGAGWSLNGGWDRKLAVDSEGTVTITAADGSARVFQPDLRSSNYFPETGDYGVLASLGGGAFALYRA